MSECIIVGNGTSVLDSENGGRINAFKNVVRFNAYQIKGFENHVGTKTTHWFNVMSRQSTGERADLPYTEICLHSWEKDADKCRVYQSFVDQPPVAPFHKFDHAFLDEMSAFAGTDYRSWSTGAIAVWMMLKAFEGLHLTGFDWWAREKHHYSDSAVRGTLHKPEIEHDFIEKLHHRVSFL